MKTPEGTTIPQYERMLRLPDVMLRIGLKKTAIYTRIKEGRFPAGRPLTGRSVAWPESQIDTIVQQIKDGELVL